MADIIVDDEAYDNRTRGPRYSQERATKASQGQMRSRIRSSHNYDWGHSRDGHEWECSGMRGMRVCLILVGDK